MEIMEGIGVIGEVILGRMYRELGSGLLGEYNLEEVRGWLNSRLRVDGIEMELGITVVRKAFRDLLEYGYIEIKGLEEEIYEEKKLEEDLEVEIRRGGGVRIYFERSIKEEELVELVQDKFGDYSGNLWYLLRLLRRITWHITRKELLLLMNVMEHKYKKRVIEEMINKKDLLIRRLMYKNYSHIRWFNEL